MKVLIAGLGSVGQRHARNLRAVFGDRVDLLAYRVRGLSRVIADDMTIEDGVVEQRYGIRSFADLSEALAARPLATFVCNPTAHHLSVARAAITAGSHVFIEKPLSHSLDGVGELIDAAESRGLIAAVGYQLRHHPALLGARDLLAAGAIGPVTGVEAHWHEYLPDAHPYEDYRTSYAARRDLGGGVVLCYIHELDYLQWLFGMPAAVSATGGRQSDLDVDVEDFAAIALRYPRFDVSCELSFGSRARRRTCAVRGPGGRIELDLLEPRLTRCDASGAIASDERYPGFRRNDLFIAELRAFFDAVRQGAGAIVSAREARASLEIAEQVRACIGFAPVVAS